MSASHPRHLRLLVGVFAPLLAISVAHAQIHEEKPGPGLNEGIICELKDGLALEAAQTEKTRKGPGLGRGDFSIVCRFDWAGGPPFFDGFLALTGAWEDSYGWKIMLGPNASVGFSAQFSGHKELHSVDTGPIALDIGTENILVVSAHRDARQPGCSIWVNGVEAASGILPPDDLGHALPLKLKAGKAPHALGVTVYNRALTRPEILELTLRGQGTASDKPKPKHPAPPPNGPRFIPQEDETIALIGGTEAVALAESGELEALLLMAFPQTKFHFRCLAWEGDTVFRQDRPMNFGSLEQQLRRVNAGAVFVMFGRQECLDAGQATRSGVFLTADQKPPRSGKNEASGSAAGADGISTAVKNTPLLEEFKTAFGKLLDTVAKVTPNIVVIGPPPFEKAQPPLPDLTKLNEALLRHEEAMKQCTSERALVFASCIPPEDIAQWKTPSLPDGITLNRDACRNIAMVMHLNLQPHAPVGDRGKAVLLPDSIDRLLALPQLPTDSLTAALAAKNRLWHDYWRPSNWAFLHGDRTTQPSSRDPVNPQVRLFPAEQEKYLPLIKEAEEKIHQLVQEAQKKLP